MAKNTHAIAIIGGQGNAPYAAILNWDGSLMTLPGLPPTGLTFRVAMNSSGLGLIGGTNGDNAYAALVSPEGELIPVEGLLAPGEIYTVAINESGKGIIGGGHLISNAPFSAVPFAAFVSSKGKATPFANLPASGLIYGVAIDNSGEGIIGGKGPLNSAYAALVSREGIVTPLAGLPVIGGIFWVATNDSKKRFIGGQENDSVYAAFVSKNGTVKPIANLPQGLNYSVAINASGAGIMGGTSLNLPFAALVSPKGSVMTLQDLPSTPGIIYNVTINDSGTGLIAGFSAEGPYGSFVAPDGSLTPLKGLPTGEGFLDGAAIHPAGVGLVGGRTFGAPFAALVAPNGTLTYLSGLPSQGEINSTAITMLDQLVPKSIGLFDSWANTQFTLSETLTQHSMIHHYHFKCSLDQDEQDDCVKCAEGESENFSLWLSVFGNDVHQKRHRAISAYSNNIVGTLLGIDYRGIQDVVIGAGLAYAYNYAKYAKHLGHTAINQESAVIYATLNKSHFYMNVALWGGGFQASNERHSFLSITSKANLSGWNISPHVELGFPILLNLCQDVVIDPFLSFDWVNNWQSHYRERGSSGFNIVLNKQYASLLRSEVGFRFFETFQVSCGKFILEEKLSYVNRNPTHSRFGTASFIGANSSFDVELLDSSTHNLGVAQVHVEYIPMALSTIYASIDYQGEWGSSFQSNRVMLNIGKDF